MKIVMTERDGKHERRYILDGRKIWGPSHGIYRFRSNCCAFDKEERGQDLEGNMASMRHSTPRTHFTDMGHELEANHINDSYLGSPLFSDGYSCQLSVSRLRHRLFESLIFLPFWYFH